MDSIRRQRRKDLLRQRYALICQVIMMNMRFRGEWTRKIFQDRGKYGHQNVLIPQMSAQYPEMFHNYTRMSGSQFDFLLNLLGARIQKQDTNMRASIPASDRLLICLRFLATGMGYQDLALAFRVGKSTVPLIIDEVCSEIFNILGPMHVKLPTSADEWKQISYGFQHKWNFPHCVGAIEGKHVAINAPPNSGSSYINYKGYFSIVLMAAVDANYNFMYVDVGDFGRNSDGGVFANCTLGKEFETLPFFPADEKISSNRPPLPYIFVADEAFPLKRKLMKPYSGRGLPKDMRIFNYRLSRSRRCVGNAFGILCARWRVLLNTVALQPDMATKVVLACCCLRNYLMQNEAGASNRKYCPPAFGDVAQQDGSITEGAWRKEKFSFYPLEDQEQPMVLHAYEVRNQFRDYFNNEGAVPWQNNV
ncbi:uncharacterized protein LOC129218766 [Uloborus diversus]|uniref:uncharacterized protein LOC129218766 n=1 Tax=Uloborus diversus TaxID=327109 RepID=UPI0024095A1B|nr:uncharacterized protein LOC129218766 [Uloborus diversus]